MPNCPTLSRLPKLRSLGIVDALRRGHVVQIEPLYVGNEKRCVERVRSHDFLRLEPERRLCESGHASQRGGGLANVPHLPAFQRLAEQKQTPAEMRLLVLRQR